MSTVISIENVSKSYQLGSINTGTFYGDLKRWWAKQRGNPDPYQKIGEADHGNRQGETLWALKDVNFQVQQGEALGIIGRNGAGKSTLLKILSRVTAPTSGEVKVKGRIASLLEVGTGFHPELTGRENIFLNGAIMGMDRREIRRKFDEIVEFSGVEKFIDTPVKRYSSGMYVRLAFAVAAHLDPEILIVDEVLAVGDAEFQKKCLGKMSDVAHEGRTVLFVSHNLQMIKILCERGLIMNNGRLIFDGGSEAACSQYLSQFSSKSQTHNAIKDGLVYVAGVDAMVKKNDNNYDSTVEIMFKLISGTEIDKLSLGFSLHDENGHTVFISYSGPRTFFKIDKGTTIVAAEIQRFSMTPGIYTIRVRLESQNDTVDYPGGDLAQFAIEMPKDLYGYRPETIVNGRLFVIPTWKTIKTIGDEYV